MTWRWGIFRGVKWTRCRHVFIISYYDLKGQNKLGRYTYLVVLHIFQHILHILQWSTRLSVCLLYVWMFIMSVSPIRCFFLCCHSLVWALSPISKGLILSLNSTLQYSIFSVCPSLNIFPTLCECPLSMDFRNTLLLYSIFFEREI